MVNLITGPRGSGKTQQMIDLANEKVKTSSGNVVFIKRSHKDTYSVDFNIRVIRMADYPDILTLEEYEVLRRFRGIILFQSIVKSVLFRHRLKRFYIFIRYLNI